MVTRGSPAKGLGRRKLVRKFESYRRYFITFIFVNLSFSLPACESGKGFLYYGINNY